MTPPIGSIEDCNSVKPVAAEIICPIASSLNVTPLSAPIASCIEEIKDAAFAPKVPRSSLPLKKSMTPPIGSIEDCNSTSLPAIAIIESIDSSLMFTSDDASPIFFIALKNATPSLANLSRDVWPVVNTVNRSVILVKTEAPPISARVSKRSLTPLNALPSIPDAFSLAFAISAMKPEISSPILTKLEPIPSAKAVVKFAIIVPMLPANCSRTGKPVFKNF